MHFSYSDPPYPGLARKYYGTCEVNHRILVASMCLHYPDGWALSTSASALPLVLSYCPKGVRVACWVRGARQVPSRRPRSAWEPLIVYRGRPRLLSVKEYSCDTLIGGGRQRTHPGAIVGMKSAAYAEWMFEQLGACRGDTLDDIFPGSGAIGRAWGLYQSEASCDGSRPGGRDASRAAPGDGSQPPAEAATRVGRDTSCLAGAVRHLESATQGGE